MASANGNSKSSIAVRRRPSRSAFAICLDNSGYPASLEVGKVYRVLLADSKMPKGWIRVVDESGEDYLYPGQRFAEVDLPQRAKKVLAAR